MTELIVILVISLLFNGALIWYVISLLRKFFFLSMNLSDIFLTFKAYEIFTKSLYNMEMFYGEPIIQELLEKTRDAREEIENFRSIFEYTLDYETEMELNDAEAEIEEIPT